jgi:hypothetical protein
MMRLPADMLFIREGATVLLVMSVVAWTASATALFAGEPMRAAMLLGVGILGFVIGMVGAPA